MYYYLKKCHNFFKKITYSSCSYLIIYTEKETNFILRRNQLIKKYYNILYDLEKIGSSSRIGDICVTQLLLATCLFAFLFQSQYVIWCIRFHTFYKSCSHIALFAWHHMIDYVLIHHDVRFTFQYALRTQNTRKQK